MEEILSCAKCNSMDLAETNKFIICQNCGMSYSVNTHRLTQGIRCNYCGDREFKEEIIFNLSGSQSNLIIINRIKKIVCNKCKEAIKTEEAK